MTIKLNEPLITALQSKLQTGLNAVIDNINATQTDPAYPIEYPQQVLDYIPPVSQMTSFPIVGISDGEMDFQDDVGWGATGVFELTVVVFLQHPDQRALVWQLRRYAQAIVRTAMEGRRLGSEGWSMTMKRVRPGPTLGRDESPRQWISTVALIIEVKSEQDS
jgi:hypothetical protein